MGIIAGIKYKWYESSTVSNFTQYVNNYFKHKTLINNKQNFMNFNWLKKIDVEKFVHGWRIFNKDKAAKLEGNIEDAAAKGVQYAEMVKEWIDNPVEDFIMKFLPKKVQDTEAKLQTFLPIIIAGLLSIKNPLGMDTALKNLKLSDNVTWDAFFHDLARNIASVLSDGKIDFADLTIAIQFVKDHATQINKD